MTVILWGKGPGLVEGDMVIGSRRKGDRTCTRSRKMREECKISKVVASWRNRKKLPNIA